MESFVPSVAAIALMWKAVDTIKNLSAGEFRSAATQLIAWVVGVLTIGLVAQTDFAGQFPIGTVNLDQLNGWSQVFIGLCFASAASGVVDIKKALDNDDSAKVAPLGGDVD